jgi:hypothetical protein
MEPLVRTASSLVTFIAAAKEKGARDEFLVKLLQTRGWPEEDIYEAFNSFYGELTGQPIPSPARASRGTSRDIFLLTIEHLALFLWTISLGIIAFMYIDQWFPAVGRQPRRINWNDMSGFVACILVALPAQLFVAQVMISDLDRYPEKAASPQRKKITYFTLFLAAGIAIADLIHFLTYFLRGEITARFILQVVTVLALTGIVFYYEIFFMKRGKQRGQGLAKA